MKKVQVWTCKIVVDGDAELPSGFDWPPRKAATEAVEEAGIEVLSCFSGWGGSLTEGEKMAMQESEGEPYPEIYFAGMMDAPEDIAH
jgi:hypothetical protein